MHDHSITPVYGHFLLGKQMNMAKGTVSLDDIQVQTNQCYQIIDRKQVGQREPVKSKHGSSNRKEYITPSDLETHPNTCYQYQHHNIYCSNENITHRNFVFLETNNIHEYSSNQLQHQSETNDQSDDNIGKTDTDNDLHSIKKCLYITALLTVVLLLSTVVAVVLSVVTYTKLSKSMIEDTSLVPLVENDTLSISNLIQTQINEIQKKIPQTLIQLNSTKIAITGLQIKFDEVKMNASQVLLQLEEANRDIINTSEMIIKRVTMQIQAEHLQLQLQLYCGAGEWHRVAHLNMSNTTESCPPVWMEYTSDEVRACKPISSEGSCPGIVYPINSRQYSKVCGRVIGYQFGSPDGFARGAGTVTRFTIDQPYVDGVSITHGNPRRHIWSYAAGGNERIGGSDCSPNTCPCNGGPDSPTYVGNNYYCESAFQDNCFAVNTFFPNDPLWDGQQCDSEGTCCTGANTPPWFKKDLSNPTSDDIEVRICHNQSSADEDSPIELLELYVQ